MTTSRSRHRLQRRRGGRRSLPYLAVAGVTAAGLVLGSAPASAAPSVYYLRGTNIGNVSPDPAFGSWVDNVLTATSVDHDQPTKVDYPGGFWPLSKGYLGDPTYNRSVSLGVAGLNQAITDGAGGEVIVFGHSQGAVVATEYLRQHPGSDLTFVLTGNPNRPNGGILQRFNGLYVPILDISFNGATPTDDATTIDIARQYDGWVDFPRYPLNLVASANALLGIVFLHGKYEEAITPEVLAGLEPTQHGNTTYYLVPTARLPLLMPFEGLLPKNVLDALDAPLRQIVELGYDRTDYGKPTPAGLLPDRKPAAVAPEPNSVPDDQPGGRSVDDADTQQPSRQRAGWSHRRIQKPDRTDQLASTETADEIPDETAEPAAQPGPGHSGTNTTDNKKDQGTNSTGKRHSESDSGATQRRSKAGKDNSTSAA
ncbi:MAG: PE-PPE domain-containing protein [Mycobacterium sp.]